MSEAAFDTIVGGAKIGLYTISNQSGLTLQTTNMGTRVVSLIAPDRDGVFADVVCGHNTIKEYFEKAPSRVIGSTVGRVANRIKKGIFTVDADTFRIEPSNMGNSIHGGINGFDMKVWHVDLKTDSSVVFSYLSPDGDEGFPGNLLVKVEYLITSDNRFCITYDAQTDRKTPINLTHHSFFNLKGDGNGLVTDHLYTINADRFIPLDSLLLPTGELASVEGTLFDFRAPATMGERLGIDNEQLRFCKGFDHCYVLNKQSDNELSFAALVEEPTNGRTMAVYTTEIGMQFYGANTFDGKHAAKQGGMYEPYAGFCLETQHFPDSPNNPSFPSIMLDAGQNYHQVCEYRFGVR